MWAYSKYAERRYLRKIEAEIARLEPLVARAEALQRRIDQARERAQLLDQFRNQTKADLDALNDLTRLIEPPGWTNSITLARETARVTGEAPQAGPLLKILDSSSLFTNSGFDSPPLRSANGESFAIHMNRGSRK